jgi:hypothetical protein
MNGSTMILFSSKIISKPECPRNFSLKNIPKQDLINWHILF